MEVLYLMDKLNASDTFYHELSMLLPSTQWSYKIKKIRTEMQYEWLPKKKDSQSYQNHTMECTVVWMKG